MAAHINFYVIFSAACVVMEQSETLCLKTSAVS